MALLPLESTNHPLTGPQCVTTRTNSPKVNLLRCWWAKSGNISNLKELSANPKRFFREAHEAAIRTLRTQYLGPPIQVTNDAK